jgi:hypothetical protein
MCDRHLLGSCAARLSGIAVDDVNLDRLIGIEDAGALSPSSQASPQRSHSQPEASCWATQTTVGVV